MSVSVAPRDNMVGTDLSVLPAVPSSRFRRWIDGVRHRVKPAGATVYSPCETRVGAGPHQDASYLDTLARENPYVYAVSTHL